MADNDAKNERDGSDRANSSYPGQCGGSQGDSGWSDIVVDRQTRGERTRYLQIRRRGREKKEMEKRRRRREGTCRLEIYDRLII